MATKKAGGSVKNGRDSWSKRLGLKKNNLESAGTSSILIRGYKNMYPGKSTTFSKNYNIVNTSSAGFVKFLTIKGKKHVLII